MADTKYLLELIAVGMLVVLTGCAVVRAPKKAYQFAYCNQLQPDGKHCAVWATPCGRLECK